MSFYGKNEVLLSKKLYKKLRAGQNALKVNTRIKLNIQTKKY